MYILNKYIISAKDPNDAAGAVNNVNPSVVTGATGNSAGADAVTPIATTAVYDEQILVKLFAITIPAGGLLAANNNYITVPLLQLGISGSRPVIAATLLGIYDPASIERDVANAGATPSFIGIWDKTVANVTSLSVVYDNLILRIPTAQIALFADKTAVIQIYYKVPVTPA